MLNYVSFYEVVYIVYVNLFFFFLFCLFSVCLPFCFVLFQFLFTEGAKRNKTVAPSKLKMLTCKGNCHFGGEFIFEFVLYPIFGSCSNGPSERPSHIIIFTFVVWSSTNMRLCACLCFVCVFVQNYFRPLLGKLRG